MEAEDLLINLVSGSSGSRGRGRHVGWQKLRKCGCLRFCVECCPAPATSAGDRAKCLRDAASSCPLSLNGSQLWYALLVDVCVVLQLAWGEGLAAYIGAVRHPVVLGKAAGTGGPFYSRGSCQVTQTGEVPLLAPAQAYN